MNIPNDCFDLLIKNTYPATKSREPVGNLVLGLPSVDEIDLMSEVVKWVNKAAHCDGLYPTLDYKGMLGLFPASCSKIDMSALDKDYLILVYFSFQFCDQKVFEQALTKVDGSITIDKEIWPWNFSPIAEQEVFDVSYEPNPLLKARNALITATGGMPPRGSKIFKVPGMCTFKVEHLPNAEFPKWFDYLPG